MTDLKTSFLAFCDAVKKGSTTCTDKTLKRICTDCKLYSKGLDANSVDIEFRKQIGNAKKEVDFDGFCNFIEGHFAAAYMKANKMTHDEAVNDIKLKIAQGSPVGHATTSVSRDSATTRLTDHTGYTGTHKERFDLETGKGKGIAGREEQLDEKAKEGYVNAYKGMGTYDKTKK
ncbi:unnamed protein product [Schistocephalus solidus]|uniref:Tubulin polymerization-promoting protein family member 3 n=1 Tax=Schistocephalus solidus TaxID=70667 RepID=A0A183S7V5_SCHSO|nr:unnamed protein product [Schistocephalus solidus]